MTYDEYSKGLDAQQTAFAVKKYKSHHHVGLPTEILASMQAKWGVIRSQINYIMLSDVPVASNPPNDTILAAIVIKSQISFETKK